MRPSQFIAAGLLSVSAMASAQESKPHSVAPVQGFVPNEAAAIQIAVAVWSPIYGAENIERQRPFRAVLRGDVWIVEGSLPPKHRGGVALAEISKKDGRILRVTHGK
jgi:uncharacterized lipoprotein YbaY